MFDDRIVFRKVRGIGEVFGDAATFIKQNLFAILKIALPIAIVPLLLGSLLMAYGTSAMYGNMPVPGDTPPDPTALMTDMFSSFALIMPGYIIVGIALTLYYILVVAYIKQYVKGVEDITLSSLAPELKSKGVIVLFGGMLIFTVLYLGILLCLFPGIYLSVPLSLILVIFIIEDKRFGDSWSRSFKLVKDNWWSTFFLYFITWVLTLAISALVAIPMYALLGLNIFQDFDPANPGVIYDAMESFSWTTPIYYIFYLLPAMVWIVIITMQYYSLVEKRDGFGLQDEINAFDAE